MSSNLLLPLVESVINDYTGASFENVKIIGVQHILETTHAMFRSLYKLGLKPENVSILGKCYSTCKEVYDEMQADGIDVSPGSFSYSSHKAFDDVFSDEVRNFITSRASSLLQSNCDCVIVLDDGGHCISFLTDFLKTHKIDSIPIVAVEQTSSGYAAICSTELPFTVINVARSPLKLTLESPMIAQAAADRLYKSLQARGLDLREALIIGAGAIGKAVKNKLSSKMHITVYDQNKELSDYNEDLSQILHRFPLIIGCTGKTSIPHQMHSLLSPGTTLVSISSSDREFDAYYLRKLLPETQECDADVLINDLLLIKSGFPVNFDNERENIEPELIQLTIAMITAGILQARNGLSAHYGIRALDSDIENTIKQKFTELNLCSSSV